MRAPDPTIAAASSRASGTEAAITVPRGVQDAIAAHARSENPRECCGLLVGVGSRIVEVIPCANVAADPVRRYEIAPVDYFRQIKRCRSMADGHYVIGAYHSHPKSAPEPSETDLAAAFHDFLFLIAGPVREGSQIDIRAYRLIGSVLEPVNLLTA